MGYDRYQTAKISTNKQGKRFYKELVFATIEKRDTDVFVITREGERLDIYANRYYGDSSLWWIIASANNIGKGTLFIDPGTRLRIPTEITEVLNSVEKVNKER